MFDIAEEEASLQGRDEEKVLCIWKYSMVVSVSLNAANLHGFFFFFLNLYSRAKCLRYR